MRRRVLIQSALFASGYLLSGGLRATTYLSVPEAQQLIWPGQLLAPAAVTLTAEQQKAIKKASGVRVRSADLNAWRTPAGDWFIVDQVIGKHEFIDVAVGIAHTGEMTGIEILTYRESYGHEVRNSKWRAQFRGRNAAGILKLDAQIRNISGATLSCSHITDAANRLLQTWQLVLSTQ